MLTSKQKQLVDVIQRGDGPIVLRWANRTSSNCDKVVTSKKTEYQNANNRLSLERHCRNTECTLCTYLNVYFDRC